MGRFWGQEEKHIKKKEMHPVLFAAKEVIRKGRDISWLLEPNNKWKRKTGVKSQKRTKGMIPRRRPGSWKLLRSGFLSYKYWLHHKCNWETNSWGQQYYIVKNIKICTDLRGEHRDYHSKILQELLGEFQSSTVPWKRMPEIWVKLWPQGMAKPRRSTLKLSQAGPKQMKSELDVVLMEE